MGLLDPTSNNEKKLLKNMFLESAYLRGTPVKIQLVDTAVEDINNDPTYTYLAERDLDILLDERPQVEVLRELNWYNEEDEVQPILAYIDSWDEAEIDVDIFQGTKVKIPYELTAGSQYKDYIIEEVKMSRYFVWVCKLVPDRGQYDYEQEVTDNVDQDTNYEFLKVDG